jgi:hypothetical protein
LLPLSFSFSCVLAAHTGIAANQGCGNLWAAIPGASGLQWGAALYTRYIITRQTAPQMGQIS